jgi:hypothetical protein
MHRVVAVGSHADFDRHIGKYVVLRFVFMARPPVLATYDIQREK